MLCPSVSYSFVPHLSSLLEIDSINTSFKLKKKKDPKNCIEFQEYFRVPTLCDVVCYLFQYKKKDGMNPVLGDHLF